MDVRFHLSADGNDIGVSHHQDVEDILEWNRQARGENQKSDWGRQIAKIPNVLYVQWLNEEHHKGNTKLRLFTPEFDEIVHRKLYDPDYAYLRTDRPALQVSGWSFDK